MRFISHHIMPLVIITLGGKHTDTQTHIHRLHGQDQFLETRRVPATGRRAPGLKYVNIKITTNLLYKITVYG